MESKLEDIEMLVKTIKISSGLSEKIEIVNAQSSVKAFLKEFKTVNVVLQNLKPEYEFIVKILHTCSGQGPLFFGHIDEIEEMPETLNSMLQELLEVETFYSFMGGLAGYYHCVIKLIHEKQKTVPTKSPAEKYYRPSGIDISTDEEARRRAVRCGIESLPLLAHICPIGGAGDRFNMLDEETGVPLPVAFLQFGGFSLLEGLVKDLQAIEFLYWKIYSKQLVIPMALMTSEERNNDSHIKSLCEDQRYFGRKAESFRQFLQPMVPVITEGGNFALSEPLKLILKPGGHGVIWEVGDLKKIFLGGLTL